MAAEDWERALVHLVRAAEAAARAFATRDALELYDEALAAAARLPGAGDRVIAIHQARSALYFVVSDFERSREAAGRARERPRGRATSTARWRMRVRRSSWRGRWEPRPCWRGPSSRSDSCEA